MKRALRDLFWKSLGFKIDESDEVFTLLFPKWLHKLDPKLIVTTQARLLADPRNAGARVRIDGRRLTVMR